MGSVREYLLGITVVALCCGVLSSVLGKKGLAGGTVKFLCGMVMLLAVVGPLLSLRIGDMQGAFKDLSQDANAITAFGRETALKEYAGIIKERTAAYILDKAESLGAELTVEVTLSDDEPLAPCGVKLSGAISPYAKKVLSDTIAKDLGVQVEDQIWTG
ncbi:MAG: hypothetical protein J6Q30_03500 [Oscillospiraceae bacterium]|nr:hypothetical protein [Oscillospiraceae bacterium]